MAIAASLLRGEMRRHLLMNLGLVASCVVAGTVVTNERGLFVPLVTGSETARAFSAMFTQSHLLPDNNDLTDVRMVSPLSPFEVTADSRDLRRRLMDSLSWLPEQAADNNHELTQLSEQTITPTELASNTVPPTAFNTPGSTAPAATSTSTTPPAVTPPSTPPSDTSVLPPSTSKPSSPEVTPEQATQTETNKPPTNPTGAVPEPSTWAMLIAGFGLIGYFLRNARRRARELADGAA